MIINDKFVIFILIRMKKKTVLVIRFETAHHSICFLSVDYLDIFYIEFIN